MKNKIMNTTRIWIALLVVCSFLMGTFTGCSKEPLKNATTPNPTKQAFNKEEDKSSNLGLWTRAMGSVLIYINDGNPYFFGGYEKTKDNREAAANILSKSWNINSRKDLLKQIQSLLKQGDRKDYLKEAKEMRAMSKKKLETAMKQLSGDTLIHYETIQYNWKNWKKRGLLAWDMCRISHLVQWGYIADYINGKEAQALIEPAAIKLQKNFLNWEEVQNNWLDGYCLYACVDRNADGNEYINRKTIYEKILERQPKDNILYDDTLFSTDIIPLKDMSYKTILKELSETNDSKASSKPSEKNKKKKKKNE